MIWTLVGISFVLGIGSLAIALLAAGDPEGRGTSIAIGCGLGGIVLVLASLVTGIGRLVWWVLS